MAARGASCEEVPPVRDLRDKPSTQWTGRGADAHGGAHDPEHEATPFFRKGPTGQCHSESRDRSAPDGLHGSGGEESSDPSGDSGQDRADGKHRHTDQEQAALSEPGSKATVERDRDSVGEEKATENPRQVPSGNVQIGADLGKQHGHCGTVDHPKNSALQTTTSTPACPLGATAVSDVVDISLIGGPSDRSSVRRLPVSPDTLTRHRRVVRLRGRFRTGRSSLPPNRLLPQNNNPVRRRPSTRRRRSYRSPVRAALEDARRCCQWPMVSARWRSVELPGSGQQNCPAMANGSARG